MTSSAPLTLGFSPCPNDTFIFGALAAGEIDTEGLRFQVVMEDIETLNNWGLEGRLDISKLSFSTWLQLTNRYELLRSGSAMGKGCGPLLIGRSAVDPKNIPSHSIAIPGVHTTANLLLDFAYPEARRRVPMRFSAIEEAVISGSADLGVIIHENRFTYQSRGLVLVTDLGAYWEEKTGAPIPLAGIAIQNKVQQEIRLKVDRIIRRSLEYAFARYPVLSSFVTENAREMDPVVQRSHIDLYVNEYSLDLGQEGWSAIRILAERAVSCGLIPEPAVLPAVARYAGNPT